MRRGSPRGVAAPLKNLIKGGDMDNLHKDQDQKAPKRIPGVWFRRYDVKDVDQEQTQPEYPSYRLLSLTRVHCPSK